MKRLLKRKVGVVPLSLIMCLAVGIAVGTILISKPITMPMIIEARYDMGIYDKDGTAPLTTIELGTFHRGDTKRFPSSGDYFIDNIGEGDLWVSWSKEDFPTGVTVKVYILCSTKSPPYTILSEGEIYTSFDGINVDSAKWYIEITVDASAQFGSFTPKLVWNGHDSSTG